MTTLNFKERMVVLVFAGILIGSIFSGFAQDQAASTPPVAEAAADADTPKAPTKLTLLGMIKQGGWAMWPLGACSLLLVTMVVMNFMKVNTKKMMPPDILAEIFASAQNQDVGAVWQTTNANRSLFTDALAAGLRHINPEDLEGSKDKMEGAIAEAVVRQEAQAGFWINFLNLVAGIAPMIGLLGTVSGMIGAFQKIGQGGMGKPELLAGNIGEALITTATGLVIAIPAVFFYFLFRNNLNRILMQAEEGFSLVLDRLTGTGLGEIEIEEETEEEAEEG